jgi:hypothetical protein
MLLLLACTSEPPPPAVLPSERRAARVEAQPALTWVDGRRICELGVERLTGDEGAYEASGLTLADGRLWVAFDNSGRLLSVAPDLTDATLTPPMRADDLEAVTAASGRLLLAEERGAVVTWADGAMTDRAPIAVELSSNKGIEGLAWAACQETLLALCEEGCGGGSPLLALRWSGATWAGPEVSLPVELRDYAGLALHGEGDCPTDYTLAVLSQKSAALWIGTLSFAEGQWRVGEGETLPLPRDDRGEPIYTTAEGVAFLDADRLAIATDAEDDSPPCGPAARPPADPRQADQSIHIFRR